VGHIGWVERLHGRSPECDPVILAFMQVLALFLSVRLNHFS
jgi:hypothetical protein